MINTLKYSKFGLSVFNVHDSTFQDYFYGKRAKGLITAPKGVIEQLSFIEYWYLEVRNFGELRTPFPVRANISTPSHRQAFPPLSINAHTIPFTDAAWPQPPHLLTAGPAAHPSDQTWTDVLWWNLCSPSQAQLTHTVRKTPCPPRASSQQDTSFFKSGNVTFYVYECL